MITAADVRAAVEWVDRSGVAAELETLLRPTKRGRPRHLTVRALLVGIKLSIDVAKTSCLTDVHRLLTTQLHHRDQAELGIVNRTTGEVISLHQVRRLFATLTQRLDPSDHHQPNLHRCRPRGTSRHPPIGPGPAPGRHHDPRRHAPRLLCHRR